MEEILLSINAKDMKSNKDQINGTDEAQVDSIEMAVIYMNQNYKDFPDTNRLHEGTFNGFIIEAVVGF